MNKEVTFAKQIERTAKRDAYLSSLMYIKQFGMEYGLKIIKEKADSHSAYLESLPFEYDYGNQTLGLKTETANGELVSEAMNGLAENIKDNLK